MLVYPCFVGSIRGGRADASLYHRLISYIQRNHTVFYDSSRTRLSAMLTGNEYFHIHPYSSEEEIYPELDKILK